MRTKSSILNGKTVLVTRSKGQAHDLTSKLEEHGALSIEIPVIEFGAPASWCDLDTALGALSNYDWIVFASSNAVSAFLERKSKLGLDQPTTSLPRIAAIGPATGTALLNLGYTVDFQPKSFLAEQFVTEFSSAFGLQGKRILWPRTNLGRKVIAEQLTQLGASVTTVESYSTNLPLNADEISDQIAQLIIERKIDVVTLASSQTTKNFFYLCRTGIKKLMDLPDSELELVMQDQTKHFLLAAIGPVTAETTRKLFGRVDLEAEVFNSDGLVDTLLRFFGHGQS